MADTILIVDDEDPVRQTFQEWLESADLGCDIFAAADAESALQIANRQAVDLAILDWNLGAGNNGLQLLEDLYLFHPDLSAIMITGYAHQATPLDAMRMGVRDYLDKSHDLNRDLFLQTVRKQLERIRPVKRERQLQRSLAEFRDAVARVLPLIQTASAISEPVPLTESIHGLLRFMQRLCRAADGVLVVWSANASHGGSSVLRAYDMAGTLLPAELLPFEQSLASAVASMQEVCVLTDLREISRKQGVQLQPFETNRQCLLAAPLPVGPGVTVVLELFDKPGGFGDEDRRLLSAAASLGGDMLKHALAERQSQGMLFAAVEAALVASEQAIAAGRTTAAARDPLAPPKTVMEQLRQASAASAVSPVDADHALRLAELLRRISVRYGAEATEQCARLLETVDRLLAAAAGVGEGRP